MNFDEWYNQYDPRFVPTSKQIARDAWDSCIKEIRYLIEDNKEWNENWLYECYINKTDDLLKKIKEIE